MSLLMRNATVTTRYGGGFVESVERALRRERGRTAASTGSTTSTACRRPRARRRRTCTPAITSGGICTTGARPTTCPPSSARSPSRSSTGSTASACPCASNARTVSSTACQTVSSPPARARGPRRAGGDRTAAMSRKRCACSSGRGPRCAAIRPRTRSNRVLARAASTRASAASGATLTLLERTGRHRTHPHRRRGPDRGHALRRRSARVGDHRHRRRRRRSCAAQSLDRATLAASLRGGAGPGGVALPAPAPVSAGG